MLAEKLLLHILIILAPILIHHAFFEKWRLGNSPCVYGVLHGVAAGLCVYVSYFSHGMYWDLRYVPIALSMLYGGPIAGGIVCMVVLLVRGSLGGETLEVAYGGVLLIATTSYFLSLVFQRKKARKRVRMIVIGSMGAVCIAFTIIAFYVLNSSLANHQVLWDYALFNLIQIIAIGFAAMLIEENLERMRIKAEMQRTEKLNTLGELAASIAHEVRNPLTAVKGFLQLMEQEKQVNPTYLPIILSEVNRAEAIISDYLTFAKPEIKKVESFSIADLLEEVAQILDPLLLGRDVCLTRAFQSNARMKTDRDQLKQALINIVKNAIEANESGGTVSIGLYVANHNAYIQIKDTGKGMNREQLSRIGTLFYSTKETGTGLGTVVSIRIIEMMKGKISYKSEPGFGTEVTIRLPIIEMK
ncbi:ATP-binding protein [Ectobacillus sp. JY-23]|uniref:ATP-binding protein n=1 Tax=Ectobacillus sp. JY-23 TaxID=2933872 RepID=UPI001FF2A4E3|nr:ATP-binding protein [Ectobacillus sp. JY-23]UOY93203.1 ATP-binding protein [Ectobacillus sp. JY-23]